MFWPTALSLLPYHIAFFSFFIIRKYNMAQFMVSWVPTLLCVLICPDLHLDKQRTKQPPNYNGSFWFHPYFDCTPTAFLFFFVICCYKCAFFDPFSLTWGFEQQDCFMWSSTQHGISMHQRPFRYNKIFTRLCILASDFLRRILWLLQKFALHQAMEKLVTWNQFKEAREQRQLEHCKAFLITIVEAINYCWTQVLAIPWCP